MGKGQSVPSLIRKMLGKEHNKQEGDNASGERREAPINETMESLVPSMGDNDDASDRGGRADAGVDGTQVRGPAVDIAVTEVAGGGLDDKEIPAPVPVPVPVPVPNVSEGGKTSYGIFGGQGGHAGGGERDGGLPPAKGGGWGGNWQGGGGYGGGQGGGGGGGGGYGIDIGSGNRAVKGNDIRIRNVFKRLSEDMQIGSQNVSEADNVISINLSSHSNPAACPDLAEDGGRDATDCGFNFSRAIMNKKLGN